MRRQKFFDGWLRLLAMRALEFAKLHDGHWSCRRALAGAFGAGVQQFPRRGVGFLSERDHVSHEDVSTIRRNQQAVETGSLIFLGYGHAHLRQTIGRGLNLYDLPGRAWVEAERIAHEPVDRVLGWQGNVNRLGRLVFTLSLVLSVCRSERETKDYYCRDHYCKDHCGETEARSEIAHGNLSESIGRTCRESRHPSSVADAFQKARCVLGFRFRRDRQTAPHSEGLAGNLQSRRCLLTLIFGSIDHAHHPAHEA